MPHYARVVYHDVFPGVDLTLRGRTPTDRQFEYDFTVRPGADPSAVRLRWEGLEGLEQDDRGRLRLRTGGGAVIQDATALYQDVDGERRPVDGRLVLRGAGETGFEVTGGYDPALPLVIDPVVGFAAYLGGSVEDKAFGLALDAGQNSYITGGTWSGSGMNGFPVQNGYVSPNQGAQDVFISKVNAAGTGLVYSTFIGSTQFDVGRAIAVDAAGNAYVTGSAYFNFPTTTGAYHPSSNYQLAPFVTKLNAAGNGLVYSTYLNGSPTPSPLIDQPANGIAVDDLGRAYVTGGTNNKVYPTTLGAYRGNGNFGPSLGDGYLTLLNAGGTGVVWSTYLLYQGKGVALDDSNNAYMTGTDATGDAYVHKISSSGSGPLLYDRRLIGAGLDEGLAVAVDQMNRAIITGSTASADFPVTTGSAYGGGTDAFVARLTAGGDVDWARYLGGSGGERGNAIFTDLAGRPTVAGETSSSNFPTTTDALQPAYGGGVSDAFATRLGADGAVAYSTYLGGAGDDKARGVALDLPGSVYVAGFTDSGNFPQPPQTYQSMNHGGYDAFVVKFDAPADPPMPPPPDPPPPPPSATLSSTPAQCGTDGCDPSAQVLSTAPGADGGDPAAAAWSPAGVRYFDGAVSVSATDLASAALGTPWGHTRSWTNAAGFDGRPFAGTGSVVSQMPYLVSGPNGSVAALTGGVNARFFDLVNGNYQGRFFFQERLTYDSAAGVFTLDDSTGARLRFYDFSAALPVRQRGQMISYADPGGNVTSVTAWAADGAPAEVRRTSGGVTESFLYEYVAAGAGAGQLQRVTLRRDAGAGFVTVRKVEYAYYASGAGALKTATVADAGGNVVATSYYRYGANGLLSYAFGPEALARLQHDTGDAFAASDATAAPYADLHLAYDGQFRVTTAVVQGAGCSSCTGGLGTYAYAYSQSANADGFNNWKTKTVETLPDGSTNTVYSNAYGEVMLVASQGAGMVGTWRTFYKYDGQGRVVLAAAPSALSGHDETKADLLNSQAGNYQYLNDSSGLVATATYAGSTTAGPNTPGNAAGFLQQESIRRGELGTSVPQAGMTYYSRTAGTPNWTIYVTAQDTAYRNDGGTGAQTTDYVYTWQGTTFQPRIVTVTLPVVSVGQNGPGTADVEEVYLDVYGRPVWAKDGEGFLHYTEYDDATGAVEKAIADAKTTLTGDFTVAPPSGWVTPSGGGLHLKTVWEVDALGRATKVTSPQGRVDCTTYNDVAHEVRSYPGWNGATTTGPTQVYREDWARGYTEALTMSAVPATSGGKPTGTEAISGLQTLTREHANVAWQVTHADAYFFLAGLTYSALPLGSENVNFYRTRYGYEQHGLPNKVQSPTGTVGRTVYDGLGRPLTEWVGTNDTGASNADPTGGGVNDMSLVALYEYDSGGVGDSNLTKSTAVTGAASGQPDRVSQFWYDWRNRLVASKAGVEAAEGLDVNRPLSYLSYDNLGEVLTADRYDGDGVTLADGNGDGVPDAPAAGLLRARSQAQYDEQGRAFRTQAFSVDPASGAVSATSLNTDAWYDRRGLVLKTAAPGGLVAKAAYDGAGRAVKAYASDGGGDATWADAKTVTGDLVLQQVETAYDKDGLVTATTTRQRFHDELASATGALGTPAVSPKARVSYAGAWYDNAGRLTDGADVGTNGGSAWSRPASPPAPSDAALVSSVTYDAAGWVDTTTDPRGIQGKATYDDLGRVTRAVEAYVDGLPSGNDDKTTDYTYDGSGHVLTLTVRLPASEYQQTTWEYGVSPATGSDVASNDLVRAMVRPNKATGAPNTADQETYTYSRLGTLKARTDSGGNQHDYTYDALGRLTADKATGLAAGVDGAVRRLETAYDGQGNASLFTSYDAPAAGSVVNQVQRQYNGLGQLTKEYQAVTGSVVIGTTPYVGYSYSEMAAGANHSRLSGMTYPSATGTGRALTYDYAAGLDTSISRLSSLSDTSGTLETYAYLGLGTVVNRAHPLPGVDQTSVKLAAEANGEAGDQYTGLDRFGRVKEARWLKASDGTTRDWFRYGYDRDGNRLYEQNLGNALFSELYHSNGATAGYDLSNQMTNFRRGTLSDANADGVPDTVATASRAQSFGLDSPGNFTVINSDGVVQNRTNNRQNQTTAVDSATLTHDWHGNVTNDGLSRTLVYDAWDRLVEVKTGATSNARYGHDALGWRVTERAAVGSPTRALYYSAGWQVVEEREGGVARVQAVFSPVYVDAIVLRDRDADGNGSLEERLWAAQDGNWNVTALYSSAGAVLERYLVDPYGVVTVLNPDWTVRAGGSAYLWRAWHQGLRLDYATSLYHSRAREYSPRLGRFLQQDPLGYGAGDVNLYRAYGNGPTSVVDPSGLFFFGNVIGSLLGEAITGPRPQPPAPPGYASAAGQGQGQSAVVQAADLLAGNALFQFRSFVAGVVGPYMTTEEFKKDPRAGLLKFLPGVSVEDVKKDWTILLGPTTRLQDLPAELENGEFAKKCGGAFRDSLFAAAASAGGGGKRDRANQRTEAAKNVAGTNRKPGKGADGRGDSSTKRQMDATKKRRKTTGDQLKKLREQEAARLYEQIPEAARKMYEKSATGRQEQINKIMAKLISENWRPAT